MTSQRRASGAQSAKLTWTRRRPESCRDGHGERGLVGLTGVDALEALLEGPRARGVASIARQVGYGTPFSLSAAFKREYGVSPQHYRLARVAPEGSRRRDSGPHIGVANGT